MSGRATPQHAAAPRRTSSTAPTPPATRDQILAAAARLSGHQGYASTTLRQIAEAAGIKAGSVYYQFETTARRASAVRRAQAVR